MDGELTEEELQDLYAWIDKIPLSRPKRHITRDFSDGVLAAEVVKYYFPKLVDLHNYVPANAAQQKLSNWDVLNRKVFSKLNFHVTEDIVNKIIQNSAGAIEPVLWALREKIDRRPESDNALEMEYYDTRNQEKPNEDQQPPEHEKKKDEKGKQKKGKEQPKANMADLDPSMRELLQEKDKEVLSMRETVEILQVKVSKLEHLVRLKDMRIEELSRHLETYKAKGST